MASLNGPTYPAAVRVIKKVLASLGIGPYNDENAQDAVGTILADTVTVDLVYDDAAPTISANVLADTSIQKVEIAKNSGAVVGTRKQLNLIEGANITLTVADDAANNQVDITIASTETIGSSFDVDTIMLWDDDTLVTDGAGNVMVSN